jgi:hypothetical protein
VTACLPGRRESHTMELAWCWAIRKVRLASPLHERLGYVSPRIIDLIELEGKISFAPSISGKRRSVPLPTQRAQIQPTTHKLSGTMKAQHSRRPSQQQQVVVMRHI